MFIVVEQALGEVVRSRWAPILSEAEMHSLFKIKALEDTTFN